MKKKAAKGKEKKALASKKQRSNAKGKTSGRLKKTISLQHRRKTQDPKADSFYRSIKNNVLPENFILKYAGVGFPDRDAFISIVDNETNFRDFVRGEIRSLCQQNYGNLQLARISPRCLDHLYMETHSSSLLGAHALAFWFFSFDEDNWFSYNKVLKECKAYLNNSPTLDRRQELRVFKGFENAGVLADPLTVVDLPVVVNYADLAVTIWAGQLLD